MIVPAETFVATLEAVTQAGGVPVLVDVRESDYNLDPDAAEAAIDSRTRFMLPVHLYGQLADMRAPARSSPSAHGLAVVEDACQAHGAERDGMRAGRGGPRGGVQLLPGQEPRRDGRRGRARHRATRTLAADVRALREHGQRAKYVHEREGYTARLDTIQAIVLLRKLPLLDGWNAERRSGGARATRSARRRRRPPPAARSRRERARSGTSTSCGPAIPSELAEFLRERGIGTGRHYPQPVHLSPAYAHLGHRQGEFPVAEALARECLSLPIFPGHRRGQVGAVVEAIAGLLHAMAG